MIVMWNILQGQNLRNMYDIKCNSGWLMSLPGGRIREISQRSAQLPPFVSTADAYVVITV